MRFLPGPLRTGGVAALGLAIIALTGAVSASASPAPASPGARFAALASSVPATTNHRIGSYSSSRMSIEVSLAPSHQAALASELRAAYTSGRRRYHQWLRRGQFDARFAPSAAERAAVARYLRSQGLSVGSSASPFLIRATGSSGQIEMAFRTNLSMFRDPHGTEYFANSSAVRMPAAISGGVIGVIGLTNTVREHTARYRRL
jgi:subtilase family serine protease